MRRTPAQRSVVAARLADDPSLLELDGLKPLSLSTAAWWALYFLTERGLPAPEWLIAQNLGDTMGLFSNSIASVAGAHGLVLHAAHYV